MATEPEQLTTEELIRRQIAINHADLMKIFGGRMPQFELDENGNVVEVNSSPSQPPPSACTATASAAQACQWGVYSQRSRAAVGTFIWRE